MRTVPSVFTLMMFDPSDAAEEALWLNKLEGSKAYAADGHASMHGSLRSSLGWSEGECRQRMQLACLVAAHPSAGEVLHEAMAPVANVAATARAHANPRCGDRIGEVIGTMLTRRNARPVARGPRRRGRVAAGRLRP